jgi:tight adherence protein C
MEAWLVALIAGAAVFLVIVGLAATSAVDPVQARLTEFSTAPAASLEELELQRPLFDRTLRPLAGRLTGIAQRLASPGKVERTSRRLLMAGEPAGMRATEFLALKVLFSIVGVILGFLVVAVLGRNTGLGLIVSGAAGALSFFGPEFWLSRAVSRRQTRIVLSLPDTLDLLTISVRAGLGFDGALAKVVEKTRGPLADEFQRALAEIRVGKPRREALRDMVTRTDVPALTNFVGAIIQADQLGVAISQVLQVQSEQLRIERRQRAEEMAAKAPIKMLFPLVGCIFPSMFIVILGPAIILIIKNLPRLA